MKKLLYIIILNILVVLSSCSSVSSLEKFVTSTSNNNHYINTLDSIFIKDSVWIHDSIYIKEKGDTIFQYSYRDKIQYLYLDKVKRDTINFTRIDTATITKPVIQEKTVEVNTLYWWQKLLMGMGILSIIIGAIIIYLKFKK